MRDTDGSALDAECIPFGEIRPCRKRRDDGSIATGAQCADGAMPSAVLRNAKQVGDDEAD